MGRFPFNHDDDLIVVGMRNPNPSTSKLQTLHLSSCDHCIPLEGLEQH